MRIITLLLLMLGVVGLLVAAKRNDRRFIFLDIEAAKTEKAMFTPAVLHDGTLYVSGQLGIVPATGKIPDDFETEVRTCLTNVHNVLAASGMDYSDIDSVQVYLTDMGQFQAMNNAYKSVIKFPRPARATVGVSGLAVPGAHIEISVIAKR